MGVTLAKLVPGFLTVNMVGGVGFVQPAHFTRVVSLLFGLLEAKRN